ncbi:MAG: ABC transporter permease subunit [Sarcina sp.]
MKILGACTIGFVLFSFTLFYAHTDENKFALQYSNLSNTEIESLKENFSMPLTSPLISPENLASSGVGVIAVNIQARDGLFNADAIDFFYSADGPGITELFVIAIIFIIFGSEFSNKTLKNILSYGMSKTEYYLAKFISISILTFVVLATIMFGHFILGLIFIGMNEPLTNRLFAEMLLKFFSAYLACISVVSISMMITVFLDKNANILIGVLIFIFTIFPILLTLIASKGILLNFYNLVIYLIPKFNILLSTNPISNSTNIISSMSISGLIILMTSFGGIYSFENKDFDF